MRTILATAFFIVLIGCASTRPSGDERGDPTLISGEQIPGTGADTVYEVVLRLHHEWLSGTGFQGDRTPLVFRDQVRMGGVEAMKSMGTTGVHSIEWLDLMEATSILRGGATDGTASGVIVVWTKPPDRR